MCRLFTLVGMFCLIGIISGYTQPTPTDYAPRVEGLKSYTSQLYMEENLGQWSPEIQAQSFVEGKQIRFLQNGLSVALVRKLPSLSAHKQKRRKDLNLLWMGEKDPDYEALVWNMTFKGGAGTLRSTDAIPGKINYFKGDIPENWTRHVSRYRQVWYTDIYPGIDIRYYGTDQEALKYDVIVSPQSNIQDLQIELEGIESLAMTQEGDLEIQTAWGPVTESRPYAYQWIRGREIPVSVTYKVIDPSTYGYEIQGSYDPYYPLIIDPLMLSWGTFLHSAASDDYATGVVKDSLGNIYMSGYTKTLAFPTTAGVYQNSMGGNIDIFLTKMNPTGTQIIWSTYVGGSGWELSYGIGMNEKLEIYLSGYSLSTDFPVTSGSHLPSAPGGVVDAFLVKLSPNGDSLRYGTYVGGTDRDYLYDLYVAPTGEAYVTGLTFSYDFPVTSSAIQPTTGGGGDVFVSKYSEDGNTQIYSTYLGGLSFDIANGIAANAAGEIYLAGQTGSSDFPTTSTAYQTTPAFTGAIIPEDAFVVKIDSQGQNLLYSTFLGGQNSDVAYDVAVSDQDEAYVTGVTYSTNFPTLSNAYQQSYDGTGLGDVFFSRLSSNGQVLQASTYLRGSDQEYAKSISLNDQNEVFILGATKSTDFPVTSASSHAGGFDAFLTSLTNNGGLVNESRYLGGSQNDYPRAAASLWIDGEDAALAITTHSPDALTTSGTYQPTKTNGIEDTPWLLAVVNDAILDLEANEWKLEWQNPGLSTRISWSSSPDEAVQIQRQDPWGGWFNVSQLLSNQSQYIDSSFSKAEETTLTYRLRLVDLNGHFVYSEVQTLASHTETTLKLSPNPANASFMVTGLWPWQRIKVYDIKGNVMYQNASGESTRVKIQAATWPEGVYICEVWGQNGQRSISKVVVAH
ncbi:MAG: T9SS type A sorting domain-containing protein [Bacteroidota bacterium]